MTKALTRRIWQLVSISRSHGIARRYFVVNGFDGALTTLGLVVGFYVSDEHDLKVAITVCLGAAIALGMSGFSSAYVSEAAERKHEFRKLQDAMISEMSGSAHDLASRWVPLMIALINGLSPLLMSLLIITPLWLAQAGQLAVFDPFEVAIAVSFIVIFLLGVFLGSVSASHWFVAGLKTLLIALVTSLLIFLLA
jgi:predicted membrane protein (TIGR00267 family)